MMRTPSEILDDAMFAVSMEIEAGRGTCSSISCKHEDYRGHEKVCRYNKKDVDLWYEIKELKEKFEKGEIK